MYAELLRANLLRSAEAKVHFSKNQQELTSFELACSALVNCYKQGGRLYIAGNGGSAADAQHLAAEFVSKLKRERAPFPAEALTTDTSVLTAIGNDYGFNEIFSRQIRGKVLGSDMFLALTTSGNSANIVNALLECKTLGVKSILFTGKNGGAAKEVADFCVLAPGEDTALIQEIHIVLAHSLCESVESSILFDNDE